MIDDSLSLNLVRGQIPAIQSSLLKQLHITQELILISCEMFVELYRLEKDSPLVKRWHKIARGLM
jgi:hypothetical protein